MDVLTLLRNDHRMVAEMLAQVEKAEPDDERVRELAEQIEQALTVHAAIEEKFFYPVLRERAEESEERVDVYEAYTEHAVVKDLIALLRSGRKQDEQFKAELQVLGENVKHHVKEEESTIFSLAEELLERDELEQLGEEMEGAKERMMRRRSASASSNGRRKTGTKKATASRNGSGRKKTGRKTAAAGRKRR